VGTNFMILGAMDQKLWVFEVFGQGLAMAGMCWSQPARNDHLCKKWRVGEKKTQKKGDNLPLSRYRPVAGGQSLVIGWPWGDDLWSPDYR
jgi:hypothetical protein